NLTRHESYEGTKCRKVCFYFDSKSHKDLEVLKSYFMIPDNTNYVDIFGRDLLYSVNIRIKATSARTKGVRVAGNSIKRVWNCTSCDGVCRELADVTKKHMSCIKCYSELCVRCHRIYS